MISFWVNFTKSFFALKHVLLPYTSYTRVFIQIYIYKMAAHTRFLLASLNLHK